jgi:glucose-6-phosphate 1-dehydrogenase
VATDASTTAPEAQASPLEGRPADRLAVFGITGDLAKVMTFRSLAHRADGRGMIELDMEFAAEGGEGPTPYEVLLHAALVGHSIRFTRQDAVEETRRVMQPLLDAPPPVHPCAPGSWGPAAADELVADFGGWQEPWLGS